MDRRRRAARTVALMSLFSMTDTRENVSVASFDGDGSDLISLIVGIEPVQAGSGDPSPANVRPISGWTEAKVTRTGKNLLNPTLASGTNGGITATRQPDKSYKLTGTATSTAVNIWIAGNYITNISTQLDYSKLLYLKAGTVVTFKDCKLFFYDIKTGQVNVNFGYGDVPIGSDAITLTVPHNVWLTGVRIPDGVVGETYNTTVYPQIELGSTATDYEPYQGETYSITFPTSAGTVYGGALDVTTGKLTVDRAEFTATSDNLNGLAETSSSTSEWLVVAKNGAFPNTNPTKRSFSICSHASYKFANVDGTTHFYNTTNGFWMCVPKSSFPTYADFANSLTGDNILRCVVFLATPIVYDLTPTQVTTLIGTNNIWADTGDIKYIEYNI